MPGCLHSSHPPLSHFVGFNLYPLAVTLSITTSESFSRNEPEHGFGDSKRREFPLFSPDKNYSPERLNRLAGGAQIVNGKADL